MKLYEAMKMTKYLTIDTCDRIYDCTVTVDNIDEENTTDYYDEFCVELQKKVEFVVFHNDIYAEADWTGFLKKNKSIFENYVKEYWVEAKQYVLENEDTFFIEWIEQLHLLLAGYGTEGTYKKLVKMLKDCK